MKAGFWEILLIVVLVLILFGHSKIPDLMKNLAQGINVFKKELKSEDGAKGKKTEAIEKSVAAKPVVKPISTKAQTDKKAVVKKPVKRKTPAKKIVAKKK